MKIRVISDLHLEFSEFKVINLPNDKDTVLIIAGDVNPYNCAYPPTKETKQCTFDFFETIKNRFKAVIYVAGNHEYYNCEIEESDKGFKKLCNIFENFHFLQGESIKIDNVLFIGATLWIDFDKNNPLVTTLAQRGMNDFRCIRDEVGLFYPEKCYNLHKAHLNYIKSELKTNKELKKVIITHHAPSKLSLHEYYKNDQLSYCYFSELDDIIRMYKPSYWVHGHMHNFADYKIDETRVICNPRGYQNSKYFEDTKFKEDLIIEV